jgi:hypothetical protein
MDTVNYIRDKDGVWWITNSKNEPLVKFAYSDEMEIAFQIGIKGSQDVLHSPEIFKITQEALYKEHLTGRKEVADWIEKNYPIDSSSFHSLL